jgi:hypothetical protein
MTLCIAAVAQAEKTIVTVSDFMLSTDTRSVDTSMAKLEPIAKCWLAGFAGDPSVCAEVLLDVNEQLSAGDHERKLLEVPVSLEGMVSYVEAAFRRSAGWRICCHSGWTATSLSGRPRALRRWFGDLLFAVHK